MPKYYVSSGDLKEVVVADDPMKAAVLALKRKNEAAEDFSLGLIFMADERGFETIEDDTILIASTNVIKEAGLTEMFFDGEEDE